MDKNRKQEGGGWGREITAKEEETMSKSRGEYTFHYFIQHYSQNMSISVICIYIDSWQDRWQSCSSFLPANVKGATAQRQLLFAHLARSSIVESLLKSQSSLSSLNCFTSLKCLSLQSCLKLFKLLKTLQAAGMCCRVVCSILAYKPTCPSLGLQV